MLDRLLLISCICIVVALILYFFYWNRLLGLALGLVIRLLYWNVEGSSIWVEIGSVHFSLLAGRILLKDIHYHSSNQSIKIVKGQLQWRYWIRKPLTEEEINVKSDESRHEIQVSSCRIQITLQGFEWFLYNRTAAYDNIISQMEESLNRNQSRSTDRNRSGQRLNRLDSTPSRLHAISKSSLSVPATIQQALAWFKQQLPILDPKDLLPLGIQVSKGVIICGNASTPSLLVAEFNSCQGTFGVTQAKSTCDLYKQALSLSFRKSLIRMTENEQFIDPMSTLGELVSDRIHQYQERDAPLDLSFRTFRRIWRQLSLYPLTLKYSRNRQRQRSFRATTASTGGKHGKVAEEETPIGADFSTLEYAVERKILETPLLELSYLVDVVGEVPPVEEQRYPDEYEYGNGDVSPDWMLSLVIHGGALRYGPWADRQRADLQRIFFPPAYQNVEQTRHVEPGDKRIWTALQVFIELRGETSLHIPFREASKDWQWDGVVDVPKRSRRREPAFVEFTVGDRSSISYLIPMVAGPSGYEAVLEVHLDDLVIASSLNDTRPIVADSLRAHGDLPSPLKWNEERTWSFNLNLRQPVLFLLRDHINMFTDLGKDWASGPPSDWQRWIPTLYAVSLDLHHYQWNLYANDQNVIDKPLLREENALVTLRGERFETNVIIPSNKFRPESTTVEFQIKAPKLSIDFSLPRWNIRAAYIPEGCNVAKMGTFNVKASYEYFSEARNNFTDNLILDFEISEVVYQAFGWSIRYWMVLRDNYLGSFTNYSTLYEYIDKRKRNIPHGDPINLKYRPNKINMFQCTQSVSLKDIVVIFPAGILGIEQSLTSTDQKSGAGACLILTVPEIQTHLRLHDYFLEMSLNTTSMYGYIDYHHSEKLSYPWTGPMNKIMMIDGLDIIANRLFGPVPKTTTYLCIWELNFGHIKLDMSFSDAQILIHAGKSFGLSFTDLANAPAAEHMLPIDPDITFYKVNVKSLETVIRAGHAAVCLACRSGIKLDSNDVGGLHYSKSTGIRIPHVSAKIFLNASEERERWLEAADFVADVYVDIYAAPKDFKDFIKKQRAFVSEQDKPTDRAARLLSRLEQGRKKHLNGVYIPQPQLPNTRKIKREKLHVVQPQPQRAFSSLHLRRQSVVENISDSENEELISEAERDARLAKTRTDTPVHVQDEEQAMSSGDESDDADLTDGESSDGDWSDSGVGGQPLTREESLFLYYARLTNHYSSLPENRPGFWESSSFVLVKDRSSNSFPKVSASIKSDIKKALQTPVAMLPDLKHGSTTIRLQSRCISDIRVTPLIVTVLTCLQNEICLINLGPELLVDGFIASCLSSLSSTMKNEGKEGSHNIVLVSSPGINISLLQNISMSDEGVTNITSLKETHIPSKSDTTARINLNLKDIEFHGVLSQSHMSSKVILGELSLQLDTISGSRNLVSLTETFECCVTNLVIDSQPRQIHCSWENLTTEIGQNGPALLVATAIALQQEISQVLEILHDMKNHQTSVIQRVVSGILQYSKDMTIIDPLSTIQPSYLIQEGIPHRLRTDPTFRFLFHLRNCLRNIHQESRNALMTTQTTPPNDTHFKMFLQSQLMSLDHDMELLPDLLRRLLYIKDIHETTTTHGSKQTPFVSLDFKKTCLRILGPAASSANEFSLSGIKAQVRMNVLDLIRHTFNNPASMSQTSFREKGPQVVKKISAHVAIDDIHFTVYSHLLVFIQHILRVRRIYLIQTQTIPTEPIPMALDDKHSAIKISNSLHVDATVCLRNVRLQAAAANLIFEVGVKGLTSAISFSLNPDKVEQSLNTSILFTKIYLQARTPADKTRQGPDQDILATFNSTGGKANTLTRSDPTLRKTLKVVFSLDGLHLIVPRSALRLYRFFEEWEADFLPGIQSTLKAVLSELHILSNKPSSSATSTRSSSRKALLQINGKINQIGMLLQVMHGTWLSSEANGVVAYIQSSPIPFSPSKITFGLQIASTVLEVSTRDRAQEATPTSRVKLTFPALSLGGDYDGRSVQTLIIIDFLDLKVKPSHWDTLLVVQQKFGQDFNDFVLLMQDTRRKSLVKSQDSKKSSLKIGGFIKMRGFRVGFEGFTSTMFFECQDIGGGLHSENGGSWDIGLTDLALSLAPRSAGNLAEAFQREHRSVFVVIDFKVIAGKRKVLPYEQTLELAITKVHAVMQPSSIGEMGDFIDYLQAEVLDRKEQRALELAAFKQKTQSIMKTFEVKTQDIESTRPWLSKYLINVTIKDLGIAFPISLDHDIPLPGFKDKDAPIKAFLFSISLVTFATSRGETGEAVMNNFSFQFVPQFRQSEPADFTGTTHQSRNRLIYPEMKAQLRAALHPNSRQVWINANVSGFILDLDPTITDYVFSLIDVYRQGKERLEQLSNNVPRTPSVIIGDPLKPTSEEHYNSVSATNVFASLIFLSGEVRMHGKAAEGTCSGRDCKRFMDLSAEQKRASEVEIFKLPVVSVWAEYRALPAKEGGQEPSILMFKNTVHSSRNTLRPTLLPFLTELVNNIEARMRKASSQAIHMPARSGSPVSTSKTDGAKAVSSMRISFSLRIDRSRLEFTCKPDVNVVAGLNWESGGFIINMSPGAKQVVFTGAVEGLSIGLKHGFLSEDCVQLDARNLSFSISLSKDAFAEDSINSISVVLDTEFHGKVKFSRLQDILCFKAVWLDLFPLFNSQSNGEVRTPLKSSTNTPFTPLSAKQTFQSVFLIRIRQINLEVDLGHSISKVNLNLTEAVMRTKLMDALNEVSVHVGELLIVAEGNLSGRARVPDCFFQTIRRLDIQSLDHVDGRMMELKLTSGPLIASLESDRQRLLHYHAEPLEIEIFDDWTSSIATDNAEQPLRLSFIVTSPGIVAAVTIGTIPKLMSYANKFEANLKAQREGASRESTTFRNALSLKPNNALSAVAEAILETAKTKYQEADSNLSYTIRQFMSLQLDSLRLVVFPRSMEDAEIAQFVSRDVKAQLDRFVATELSPLRRDLRLSFSSMTISKYTLNQPFNRPRPGIEEGRAWLEAFVGAAAEAIVVGLPSMTMHMTSEEMVEDVKKLVYDFNSNFIRQGMKDFDDIYITLNVALYSWLTVLRKNLTREMDQVRATAEWRTSISPGVVSPTVGEKRKQPLDLLTSPVSPKSMTLPPALSTTAPSAHLGKPLRSTSAVVSADSSIPSPLQQTMPAPFLARRDSDPPNTTGTIPTKRAADIKYEPRNRSIERLTMRQLGEATPDVMHPFFMKKAGFNLEDSLPQYVNEYATTPLEEIMEVLLKLYSRQVKANKKATVKDG